MKEFLVGLLSLLILAAMAGVAVLLIPFLMVLALFLRIFIFALLGLFSIWLLGKVIIVVFQEMKE